MLKCLLALPYYALCCDWGCQDFARRAAEVLSPEAASYLRGDIFQQVCGHSSF